MNGTSIPFDPTSVNFLTSNDNPAMPVLDTSTAPDTTGINYSALDAALNPTTGATYSSPSLGMSAGDTSNSSSVFSGLGSMFSAVGNAVTQSYRAVTAPTGPQVLRPGASGLVYNPATGTYISSAGFPVGGLGMGSNTMFFLILILIAFFLFRR